MANFTFNNVLGKVRFYTELPAANDALILVLLQFTGLEADATLRDYDDLSTLLAGASNEMTFTGWARRTLAGITPTVDDTNERVDVDATDATGWTNTGGASERAGKALIVYDPDTTTGTDTTVVPLLAYDCDLTFDVGALTTTPFNAAGFVRFTN
jgi:hypothetical protein